MGQHLSKSHEPLTFAYVNCAPNEESQVKDSGSEHTTPSDLVLANPHLYKFEITCQNNCERRQSRFILGDPDSSDEPEVLSTPETIVLATEIGQQCKHCRQTKRLSLMRRDLAKDLAYIDETYYRDIAHYVENDDTESELVQPDDEEPIIDGNKNWSRLTFGEVAPGTSKPRLASPPLAVDLSGRSLIQLSPSIGYFSSLSRLDLSRNQITQLPRTIGYLKNLTVFNASHNQLESIPDTISYLSKLTTLNLSHNNLSDLPPSIGALPKLAVLIVNDNKLTKIPRELGSLATLLSLNVSNNPLRSLPAEIGSLTTLRKLVADGCDFVREFSHQLEHQPPTLFEICARKIVRTKMAIPSDVSDHIKHYFSKMQTCSYCGGPYFESFVTRGRFIERVSRQQIALEYNLCSAHWNDEDDRILSMFSSQPDSVRRASKRNIVNTDGLQGSPSRGILSRHRAYSDTSHRSQSSSSLYTLSHSPSPLSQRSTSSLSLAAYTGSTHHSGDQPLVRQPSLPALPAPFHSSLSNTTARTPSPLAPSSQRQRSSSTASMTKKITGFLTSPSKSFTRARSSSNLSRQQWSSSDSSLTGLSVGMSQAGGHTGD